MNIRERFGLGSSTNKKNNNRSRDEDATSEENDNELNELDQEEDEEEEGNDDDDDLPKEDIEAMLIPSDQEKKAVLASFDNMRKESLFCDIAFVSQGVLFRAHRVIVSSWSRWLQAFLAESPEEGCFL